MAQTIKQQLANALEIEPEDIMGLKECPDGTYNVINFNFQKFTGVVPKEVSKVPVELRKIYQKPQTASKAGLVKLCKALEIEIPTGATKKVLVALVNEYRELEVF